MILTEDVVGLDLKNRPETIRIDTLLGRPTARIRLDMLPRHTFRQIEQAIIDQGYRLGIRGARAEIRETEHVVGGQHVPVQELIVRVTYG